MPWPSKGAPRNPPGLVAVQLSPILICGLVFVPATWDDGLHPLVFQLLMQGIVVEGPIRDHLVWPLAGSASNLAYCYRVEGFLQEHNFRWGCRVQVGSQQSFCWSLSWTRKACHSVKNISFSSRSLSHRQQVLGLPYCRGGLLQVGPVQRIQRIPSMPCRSSTEGRPFLGQGLGTGKWTQTFFYCSSVAFSILFQFITKQRF